MKLYRILTQIIIIGSILFIVACNSINEASICQISEKDALTIDEAKEYFEKVYVNVSTMPNTKGTGRIIPENYTINWNEALVSYNSNVCCVNIPITAISDKLKAKTINVKDGKIHTYQANVFYKLCILKNIQQDILSCHIVSIIPADKHSDKNKKLDDYPVVGSHDHCFTGLVLYHTLNGRITYLKKYIAGHLVKSISSTKVHQMTSEEKNVCYAAFFDNISFSRSKALTRAPWDEDDDEDDYRCSDCGEVVCNCYECLLCGDLNCTTDHFEECPICGSCICIGNCEPIELPYDCEICLGNCLCPYGKCHKSPCICNR